MPACGLPGEHAKVNLQVGAGTGAGARNVLHQPVAPSFLNTLILTVVRTTFAALFIHSSL